MRTLVSSTNSRCPFRARALWSRGSLAVTVDDPAEGPASERLRRFKYFLRVTGDFHLAPFLAQHTGAIDQERAPFDAQVLPAIQTLLFDDIEESAQLLVLIREEIERQLLLFPELVVGLEAVARDAHDAHACLAKCRIQVAEILALAGAAGGHVLRVEVQDDLLALGVFQTPRAAVSRGGQGEVRNLCSNLRGGGHDGPAGFEACDSRPGRRRSGRR